MKATKWHRLDSATELLEVEVIRPNPDTSAHAEPFMYLPAIVMRCTMCDAYGAPSIALTTIAGATLADFGVTP